MFQEYWLWNLYIVAWIRHPNKKDIIVFESFLLRKQICSTVDTYLIALTIKFRYKTMLVDWNWNIQPWINRIISQNFNFDVKYNLKDNIWLDFRNWVLETFIQKVRLIIFDYSIFLSRNQYLKTMPFCGVATLGQILCGQFFPYNALQLLSVIRNATFYRRSFVLFYRFFLKVVKNLSFIDSLLSYPVRLKFAPQFLLNRRDFPTAISVYGPV